MTFAAIVTCYESTPMPMINCLNNQTRPPDEIYVSCCPEGSTPSHSTDPRIQWCEAPPEHDFGFAARNRMAARADADYIGFFSHDDSYHPEYIERMMTAAKDGAQIVWCPWSDRPKCEWKACDSTLGNFIIRRKKFLEFNGFELPPDEPPVHRLGDLNCQTKGNHGFRDAWLIDRLIKANTWPVVKVPYLMYYHNAPYADTVTARNWGDACISASYMDWLNYTNYQMKEKTA